MLKMQRLMIPALAGLAMMAASCGGSETTADAGGDAPAVTTTTASAITKAEYNDKADAVCTRLNTQLDELDKTETKRGTPEHLAKGNQLLTTMSGAITELKALPKPAGDEATLDAIYTDMDAYMALLQKMADASAKDDLALAKTFEPEGDKLSDKSETAMKNYGMKVCGGKF